jgi:methanogenic corrinoid protein MtbC1
MKSLEVQLMAETIIEEMKRMVKEFDTDNAEAIARKAVEVGVDPLKAAEALTEGIREVGDKFGTGELFLPDLVCASEVVKQALPIITEEIERLGKKVKSLGKIVIGTVFGYSQHREEHGSHSAFCIRI